MEKKNQTDSSCPRDIVEKKAQIVDFLAQQQAADNQWLAERQKEQLAKWEQDRAVQLKKASDEKKVNPLDELQPFNLDVTITETAPGSAFLKFIGSVLNGAKADLVAEVKTKAESYTPAEKSKAADDLNALYADAATKKAAVEGQILKINAESDENKKAVLALDLPQLKIQANGAFRKAGLAEPYPGIAP